MRSWRRPLRVLALLAALLLAGSMVTALLEAARRLLVAEPLDFATLPFASFDAGTGTVTLILAAAVLLETVLRER